MHNKLQQRALMCGLVLSLSCSTAWAFLQNNLRSIELDSTRVETRVILKTDGGIPFRIISKSPEKIVIDFSSVDPTQSIPTDFTSANNIEQVVLKPLGSDKLRLVIRGEHLGAPVVSTNNPMAQLENEGTKLVMEDESSAVPAPIKKKSKVMAPDENGIAFAAVHAPKKADKKAAEKPEVEKSESASSTDIMTEEEAPSMSTDTENEAFDIDAVNYNLDDESATDRKALVDPDNVSEKIDVDNEEAGWQDYIAAIFESIFAVGKNLLQGMDKSILFGICAVAGSIIMIGMLIRNKASRPRDLYGDEDFEPAQSGGGFFGGLFGGGNHKAPVSRRQRQSYYDEEQARGRGPRGAADRPVGLRGLGSPEQMLPPAATRNNLANQNHAINQYARNSRPTTSGGFPGNGRDSREIDWELHRSVNMRKQGVMPAPAQKQYSKPVPPKAPVTPRPIPNPPQAREQQPLPPSRPVQQQPSRSALPPSRKPLPPMQPQRQAAPPQRPQQQPVNRMQQANAAARRGEPGLPANNTEVLEFLRNVAELMEKDGKPNLANGVKKGMAPRRP